MQQINFTIPGHPVAKARARVTRHGTYTPEATQNYKSLIQVYARQAMGGEPPLLKGVELKVFIYRKSKPATRPDIDNYVKAIMDGCNSIIWHDDAQVVRLWSEKILWDSAPQTPIEKIEVEIMEL